MRVVPPTRSRRLRRAALLALGVSACAASPAVASPTTDAKPFAPPLRLRIGDGSIVIPPATVQAASDTPANRAITLRGAAGERTDEVGGTSIGAFLTAIGLPLEGLGSVELQVGTGRTVTLSGDEIRDGFSGDQGCPGCKATLDIDRRRGTVHFVRPLRNGSDTNADDELAPRSGQTLYLRIRSDRGDLPAAVQAVGGISTRVGRPHRFKAVAPGVQDPQFTWFFGDDETASGPTATHAFSGAGFWPVSVLVVAGGRFGAATLGLQVRPTRNEPQAKDPAAATPTPTATPSATPAPSTAPGAGGPSLPATVAPAAPPAPAPAPVPTTAPASPAPTPDATPAPLVPPPPGATQSIRGLLASAAPEPTALAGALTAAEALAAQPDRPAPAPKKDREVSGAAAGSAVSGMLLVGLLSAGALTERRRARRATDLLR